MAPMGMLVMALEERSLPWTGLQTGMRRKILPEMMQILINLQERKRD